MMEIMQITGTAALISDITKTFSYDAASADMLLSSYRAVCSDPELSDNEKLYFDKVLDGMAQALDQVRNPQIFDSGKKRAIKLFFCPSKRKVPAAAADGTLEKEDVFYKKMSDKDHRSLYGPAYRALRFSFRRRRRDFRFSRAGKRFIVSGQRPRADIELSAEADVCKEARTA